MSAAAIKALREYGAAIRGDWGSLDGRSVRMELDDIASALEGGDKAIWDIGRWRLSLGICPSGVGHWTVHCSAADYGCGNEPTRW